MRRVAAATLAAVGLLVVVGTVLASCASGSSHSGRTGRRAGPQARTLSVGRAVGQLIIATYAGTRPPATILQAVRAGHVGAIILMGDNTAGGVAATRTAIGALQRAAGAGANPGLLIMTDQEGGTVRRLPGPPAYAAAQMGSPARAGRQGYETGLMLRRVGVNVDLAPVADVSVSDGFMTRERRTFGRTPATVAAAACAFARGLARGGVAYTLKHFPGLGAAAQSTDLVPVSVDQTASAIRADDAAYRACGHSRLALVMVASASYSALTGRLPAVLSPVTYRRLMAAAGIDALPITDSLQSGAIRPWATPARRAVAAGADMVMYPNLEADALRAYAGLLGDVRDRSLAAARVRAAAVRVLALKRTLGLD